MGVLNLTITVSPDRGSSSNIFVRFPAVPAGSQWMLWKKKHERKGKGSDNSTYEERYGDCVAVGFKDDVSLDFGKL
jgi:hypothetical protein